MSASVTTLKLPRETHRGPPPHRDRGAVVETSETRPKVARTTRRAEAPSALPPVSQVRYALRTTVRYRVKGRPRTGIVIGITYTEPPRYDIGRENGDRARGKKAELVSRYIPHEDIVGMLAPPPDQSVMVLEDFPPEPRAICGEARSMPMRKGLLSWLLDGRGPS